MNHSAPQSLQDAIVTAGSAVRLLWRPRNEHWTVPIIEAEYAGWQAEQAAWREGVVIMDLSHHMSDLFIEGPDATTMLMGLSANDYSKFALGQAKQFIPVNAQGQIITDGILLKEAEDRYTLSGVPASQSWVKYHGETGGYDVSFQVDPDSSVRRAGNPVLFRYQIQGPLALDLVAKVFDGPLPPTKFFHSVPVTLDGRQFRAFRHGMAGQAGYEFVGQWADAAYIKELFLRAGEEFGLIHVGGKAYFTNGIESGWIPTPTPAIYSDPALEPYRRSLSAFSFEGKKPLHGSFFSEEIADYYVSPWELGYGKSIAFNHDFIGRDALEAARDQVSRKRVTLEFDEQDVRRVFGAEPGYQLSYGRYRIEAGGSQVGTTFYTGNIAPVGRILSLSLVEHAYADPGTQVTVVWGEHPGPDAGANAEAGFAQIRATVQPSPYNDHARTAYRAAV